MDEIHKKRETIRNYLLGTIEDASIIDLIEENLFSDSEYLTELEISEDELIDEYVKGELNATDLNNFQKLFLNVPERIEKIKFAETLLQFSKGAEVEESNAENFDVFKSWFFKPQFLYAFTTIVIVGIGCLIGVIILKYNNSNDDLAELKSLYQNKRPIEARIVGFDYTPLIVLRGMNENNENEIQRRKIEKDLLAAAENNPTAQNFNALGVFYLTEKKFDEASVQFEKAIKINPRKAEFRSNLGAAYFEKAKMQNNVEKNEMLEKALENFNKAIEINSQRIEAFFDKALVLQEMNRTGEAIEAWNSYLNKDSASKWADEARRNLSRLKNN